MMIEVYCNPLDQVHLSFDMNPLQPRLAFVSANPEADQSRYRAAGATLTRKEYLPDRLRIVMSRDASGLTIQFCRRSTPLLKFKT